MLHDKGGLESLASRPGLFDEPTQRYSATHPAIVTVARRRPPLAYLRIRTRIAQGLTARQRVKRNESALVTFCTGHERKDITPQGHQWRLQTLYRRWLCTVRCACPRSMSTATISNLRTTRDSSVIAPAKAPSEKSLKTGARSCGRSAWIRWARIPAVSYPRKSSTKFLH